MRPALLILGVIGLILIGAGAAGVTEQEPKIDHSGISTAALSRCAGIAGMELRSVDPAFGAVMLDGAPWISTYQDHDALMVTSTGALRRRNGTTLSFRFVCALNDRGRASMIRITSVGVDETLPPSRSIRGTAVLAGLKSPLPRGAELRVQLLDVTSDPKGEVVGEQVVRSGWEVPIAFALRVKVDAMREGSSLAIAARVVLAGAVIYRLASPRMVTPEELRRPLILDLSP